jgi:hypothetical protein
MIARDLKAVPGTHAAILARAYAAGQIPFRKLRRSCPEPVFRRLLTDSIGSYPLAAQQVNEILSAVQTWGFTALERSETYANCLAQCPSAYRERLADLVRSEAKPMGNSGELGDFLFERFYRYWRVECPPALDDCLLAWDLFQMAEFDEYGSRWGFITLARIADTVRELDVPSDFLARLKSEVDRRPDPAERAGMAIDLAHLLAHVPGSGALEYAYKAADSLVESRRWAFRASSIQGFIRLHRLLRQPSVPQKYVDAAVCGAAGVPLEALSSNLAAALARSAVPAADIAGQLADGAVDMAEVDREGARRLLELAAGLEPCQAERGAFGVHAVQVYVALAAHRTGLDVRTPPLAQSLGQMACFDANGDEWLRFRHILMDIAETSPKLALEVYPVLRTDRQRFDWLDAIEYAAEKQGQSYLRQVPGFGARLAAIAHSMPSGYNRAKSLGMVGRIMSKL